MKLTPKSASPIRCVVIKPRERDLSFSEDIFLSLAEVNSDHLRPKYYHFAKYTVWSYENKDASQSLCCSLPHSPKPTSPAPCHPTLPALCHHQARINIGCQVRSTWAFTHNPREL